MSDDRISSDCAEPRLSILCYIGWYQIIRWNQIIRQCNLQVFIIRRHVGWYHFFNMFWLTEGSTTDYFKCLSTDSLSSDKSISWLSRLSWQSHCSEHSVVEVCAPTVSGTVFSCNLKNSDCWPCRTNQKTIRMFPQKICPRIQINCQSRAFIVHCYIGIVFPFTCTELQKRCTFTEHKKNSLKCNLWSF